MNNCMLILAATASLAFGGAAPAQDVVKVKPGHLTYKGEIVRYDERGVALKWGPREEVKEFPTDKIEEVLTFVEPAQTEGDAALAKAEYAEAARRYRIALSAERRAWAKDRIRFGLLRSLRAIHAVKEAAEVFVALLPRRPDPEIMAYAPLRWLPNQSLPADLQPLARSWLDGTEDAPIKLLAADWLLDAADRPRALATLEKLLTDPDVRVAPLARALLMRSKLESKPIPLTAEDVAEYRTEVEQTPAPLRFGPQYVLGLAVERFGTPTDAAFAFLKVPFVLGGPPEVQADAMFRAAAAAERAEMKNDARKLYRELLKRYPQSDPAAAAKKAGKG